MSNNNRGTILICDDDSGVQEAYKLILSDHYQLKLVDNGQEALSVLKTDKIDLVILDLKMPEMDGLQALGRIRQAAPQVPVVISTGYKSAEIALEATRLGCKDYLIKPFEPRDVLGAAARLITAKS